MDFKELNLEMELLNSEEMNSLEGGVVSKCTSSEGAILCMPDVADLVLCTSSEGSCGSNFSSTCSILTGVVVECGTFKIK